MLRIRIPAALKTSICCLFGGTYLFAAQFAHANLFAATLPASRSVETGVTATFFATIINSGSNAVDNCRIGLASPIDADLFFQTTDPNTNAVTGSENQPVTIAAGGSQSFLVGITPNSELEPTNVELLFDCNDVAAAPSFIGINSLLLSASNIAPPDIVAIALTPTNDGVAQLPQDNDLGFLSIASVNVGSFGNLTVAPRVPADFEGDLLICQTNPADGVCLETPSASVDLAIADNDTPTFAVFLSSFLATPLDPANKRLFVDFSEADGTIRGSTSVALSGGGPNIVPQFTTNANGFVELPSGAAADQTQWFINELSVSETTTAAEVRERFSSAFIASSGAQGLADFLNGLRTGNFGDAGVIDLVAATPILTTTVIATSEETLQGFVNLGVDLSTGLISQLSVQNFGGTVQFAADQQMTMAQAADQYIASADDNSLLVARINRANQCVPILERNSTIPRATASLFKIWSLGSLARAIDDGSVSPSEDIPLQTDLFALGSRLNSEPEGLPISVRDMANLMIGVSDNTATDHIHAILNQELLASTVNLFNHASPELMQPFLSISQNFSIFFSFSLAVAESYVEGSEAFQSDFFESDILPLGSVLGGSFFNDSLLVDGAWQASPVDACNAFASLRAFPPSSAAFDVIDFAMSAGVAQPGIRERWDRVWFKGGNLIGQNNDQRVLTLAWFLESAQFGRFVVVAMANNRVAGNIDTFVSQSLTSRILETLADSVQTE